MGQSCSGVPTTVCLYMRSGCILTPCQEASRAAQAHFSYKKRGQIADSCTKNMDLWWGEMGVWYWAPTSSLQSVQPTCTPLNHDHRTHFCFTAQTSAFPSALSYQSLTPASTTETQVSLRKGHTPTSGSQVLPASPVLHIYIHSCTKRKLKDVPSFSCPEKREDFSLALSS